MYFSESTAMNYVCFLSSAYKRKSSEALSATPTLQIIEINESDLDIIVHKDVRVL